MRISARALGYASATFLVAAFLPLFPSPASAVSYGPDLARSAADRPDDATGAQIHFLYVVPSDGADRALDTSGAIRNSVSAFQTWLAGRADGRTLRPDTFQGSLDISFLRLSRTDADIASTGSFVRDAIEKETKAAGFDQADKIYGVFYDGTSSTACGGGAWPPQLPGNVAAMYLKGLPDGPVPCSSNQLSPDGTTPGYLDISMLHEIMHTIGFVASCAPNQTRSGHVSDSQDDLMWAGDAPWAPSGWANLQLDVGNNDYYRTGSTSCMDLDKSPYLTGNTGHAVYPPSSGAQQPAPPSVQLSSSVISAGEHVTVTYRGTPGDTVQILSKTQPATGFSVIATVTLDASGLATSTHAPQKNTRITAQSAGGPSADQPLVQVRSVASLSAHRMATRNYTFTGRVYPALNQRLVSLYRNGALVAQGRCDASGVYSINKSLAAGTFSFFVRTSSDTYNVGTTSPTISVRIS
jgi:hypothetical protein